MSNGDDLLRLYYEQAIASYTREAGLLFERTNYFLASMAFVIVAFVTLIVKPEWAHSVVIYSIVCLGMILASMFWATNLIAQAVILRQRDYIYKVEERMGIAQSLGEAVGLAGPYKEEFPDLDPKSNSLRFLAGFLSRRPAIHTVVVPPLFFLFWGGMLVFLSRPNWAAMNIECNIVTAALVIGTVRTVLGLDSALGPRKDNLNPKQSNSEA